MPPAAARNFCVVLYDLKTGSRSWGLNTLVDIILYKNLSGKKDEYKLFLVNVANTSNALNHKGVAVYDPSVERLVEELQNVELGQSDWLEALDVAANEIKDVHSTASGIVAFQIVFITDLSAFERPNNGKLLDSVVRTLRELDIFLYVIGPDVEPPKTIFTQDDVKSWMVNLQVDQANSNLRIMKKIVKNTEHSVICSYRLGLHLFKSFVYKKGMQPWQEPLTFGTCLQLPTWTIRVTKREAPFFLKKAKPWKDSKWVYEDEEDVEVDRADVVPGIVRHGKFVKIETDGKFKIQGKRSFLARAFTSMDNVSEYYLQSDGSHMVIPSPKCESEGELALFYALVEELAESNKCIIARRVYNKDFNPKFVALIPKTDSNCYGFILCDLPYADDVAHKYVERKIESAPKLEQNEKVVDFLESINVNGDRCKLKVPLTPGMMLHSKCLPIMKKVKEKLLVSEQNRLDAKFEPLHKIEFESNANLSSEWPSRDAPKPLKEEDVKDDFDDVDDFNF